MSSCSGNPRSWRDSRAEVAWSANTRTPSKRVEDSAGVASDVVGWRQAEGVSDATSERLPFRQRREARLRLQEGGDEVMLGRMCTERVGVYEAVPGEESASEAEGRRRAKGESKGGYAGV